MIRNLIEVNMTKNILVHWTQGPVYDCGDCYKVEAIYQMGEKGKLKKEYLCHLEEARLLSVSNHFKTSIDVLEIPFGDSPL